MKVKMDVNLIFWSVKPPQTSMELLHKLVEVDALSPLDLNATAIEEQVHEHCFAATLNLLNFLLHIFTSHPGLTDCSMQVNAFGFGCGSGCPPLGWEES
jgi:hypothetical protein